jgi:hypothetical protein
MSLEQFQAFDKEMIEKLTRPDRPTPLEQTIRRREDPGDARDLERSVRA